jgi:hypothetical protein
MASQSTWGRWREEFPPQLEDPLPNRHIFERCRLDNCLELVGQFGRGPRGDNGGLGPQIRGTHHEAEWTNGIRNPGLRSFIVDLVQGESVAREPNVAAIRTISLSQRRMTSAHSGDSLEKNGDVLSRRNRPDKR